MAAATYAWVERTRAGGIAVGVLAPEGQRSPTVTVITLPDGVTGPNVLRGMTERGYTLGAGYGSLGKTSVRIGHMGDHTVEGVERCLAELGDVLVAAAR